MLGPEHVRARLSKGELSLSALAGRKRERALELAAELGARLSSLVGERRADVESALRAVESAPAERRLALGLAKLLLDQALFGEPTALDAPALRREVFELATERRRALLPGAPLDRGALIREIAEKKALEPEALERALYSDLRGEGRLERAPRFSAIELVEIYERAARQAVLLRAVSVTADVACRSPYAYRALFGKLKFRRLLHSITRHEGGYRIVINGPYSLFESVTKYGLALALVLPALEECEKLDLRADVKWGPRRAPAVFRYSKVGSPSPKRDELPPLPDELEDLVRAFAALDTPWNAIRSEALLDLPGVGVCAPDLEFVQRESGVRVFFELLGYWSRDAVWKRVELVERGLAERVIFAVSSRLRVSEEVLDESASGALYVFKGALSAKAIARRLDSM